MLDADRRYGLGCAEVPLADRPGRTHRRIAERPHLPALGRKSVAAERAGVPAAGRIGPAVEALGVRRPTQRGAAGT
ncbi:hypothetical protein GCM10025734_80930 [Kitasatospora paranensis]